MEFSKCQKQIVNESDPTGDYLHVKLSSSAFNRHGHLHRAFAL